MDLSIYRMRDFKNTVVLADSRLAVPFNGYSLDAAFHVSPRYAVCLVSRSDHLDRDRAITAKTAPTGSQGNGRVQIVSGRIITISSREVISEYSERR
jgi:hypothetical protein